MLNGLYSRACATVVGSLELRWILDSGLLQHRKWLQQLVKPGMFTGSISILASVLQRCQITWEVWRASMMELASLKCSISMDANICGYRTPG
jgi:hypothetical protein